MAVGRWSPPLSQNGKPHIFLVFRLFAIMIMVAIMIKIDPYHGHIKKIYYPLQMKLKQYLGRDHLMCGGTDHSIFRFGNCPLTFETKDMFPIKGHWLEEEEDCGKHQESGHRNPQVQPNSSHSFNFLLLPSVDCQKRGHISKIAVNGDTQLSILEFNK